MDKSCHELGVGSYRLTGVAADCWLPRRRRGRSRRGGGRLLDLRRQVRARRERDLAHERAGRRPARAEAEQRRGGDAAALEHGEHDVDARGQRRGKRVGVEAGDVVAGEAELLEAGDERLEERRGAAVALGGVGRAADRVAGRRGGLEVDALEVLPGGGAGRRRGGRQVGVKFGEAASGRGSAARPSRPRRGATRRAHLGGNGARALGAREGGEREEPERGERAGGELHGGGRSGARLERGRDELLCFERRGAAGSIEGGAAFGVSHDPRKCLGIGDVPLTLTF